MRALAEPNLSVAQHKSVGGVGMAGQHAFRCLSCRSSNKAAGRETRSVHKLLNLCVHDM